MVIALECTEISAHNAEYQELTVLSAGYTSKTNKQADRKRDQSCGYQKEDGEAGDWMKLVKSDKLPVIRQIRR